MRLTCPRCGAQYEIDGTEIPAAGRLVECTACGNTWRHVPDESGPLRLVPSVAVTEAVSVAISDEATVPRAFDAADRPVLNQPLSESILSILREEAGREISARRRDLGADAAEAADGPAEEPAAGAADDDDPDYSPPPLPAPGTDAATDEATRILPLAMQPTGAEDDALWPATTLTHPAPPVSANILASRLEDDLAAEERNAAARDGAESDGDDSDGHDSDTADETAADPHADIQASSVAAVAEPARDVPPPTDNHPQESPPEPPAKPPAGDTRPIRALAAGPTLSHGRSLPPPSTTQPARPQVRAVPHHYAVPVEADPAADMQRRRRAYDSGFSLVLMVALAALALYALAPRVADQGAFGARLMELRAQADEGRAWLQARADALIEQFRR